MAGVPAPLALPQTLELWDGLATIDVPPGYQTQTEADGTLVVYPPGAELITLRLAVLTFKTPAHHALTGLDLLRLRAQEDRDHFHAAGEHGIMLYEEPADDHGEPAMNKYWNLGMDDEIVILSATILQRRAHDPAVRQVLSEIPAMLDSIKLGKKYEFVDTPWGTLPTQMAVVRPEAQLITDFGPAQIHWLQRNLELARHLAQEYMGWPLPEMLDPQWLDQIFLLWRADHGPAADEAKSVADALGAAFGEWLVQTLAMRWVVVDDQYGSAYAVRHERREAMAFPVTSVTKRMEHGDAGFLTEIAAAIQREVGSG